MVLDTLFRPTSSAAAGDSGDYVKKNFDDTTLPADSNSGFSSTLSSNPLSHFYQNDDLPKYGIKTLFIKDAVLIEDRTKWVNNKPTYDIKWTEDFVGIKGYVYGNIRKRSYADGLCLEIKNIDDAIGVGGIIRQVAWICNPSTQVTASADFVTDGADTGNDATFNLEPNDSEGFGVNKYNAFLHNAALSSYDIHDYKLQANEYGTLNVCGVIVYFQNSALDIDYFPGKTFVDKALISTSNISSASLPIVNNNGAITAISKDSNGIYNQSIKSLPYINSVGVGSSGTNIVNVTTGHGASLPNGSAFIYSQGGTNSLFHVTNQSTDALTVLPTLSFGISGLVYKSYWYGSTITIGASLFKLVKSLDVANAQNNIDLFSPAIIGQTNVAYYQDPVFSFRLWGRDLISSVQDGYQGIAFSGNTQGFFQIDGDFQALELEMASGGGIFNGTFAINGIPAYSDNAGFTGVIKKTVFSDGMKSFNSVRFGAGSSLSNLVITKINMYQYTSGVTLGILSELDSHAAYIDRGGTVNASMMNLGAYKRIFADSLYFKGTWTDVYGASLAGGIAFQGTTSAIFNFQYYGKDFAVVGVSNGASILLTLDGASINSQLNAIKSVATMGWHAIQGTWQGSTLPIAVSAIDFQKPLVSEISSKLNSLPLQVLRKIPTTFIQSDTPKDAINGDIWMSFPFNNTIWIRLFNKWIQFNVNLDADDPNASVFVRSHGSSTNANAGALDNSEHFNLNAWLTGISSGTARWDGFNSDTSYMGYHHVGGGVDTSGTQINSHFRYNKISWQTLAVLLSTRTGAAGADAFGYIYKEGGINSGSTETSTCDRYNFNSWTNMTNGLTSCYQKSAFLVNNLLSTVGGDNGGGAITTHVQRTSADSTAIVTAIPTACRTSGNSRSGVNGLVSSINTSTAQSYKWDGASWSSLTCTISSATDPYGFAQANYFPTQLVVKNGSSAGSPATSTETFNGTSYLASISSTTGRSRGCASVI